MIAQNFSRRCGRKGFSLLLLICATVDSKTEIPDQWLLYTVCLLLEKSEICCFLLTVKIWSMMKNVCCCIIWTSQATLTFSIWHCDQFDLDLLTDDECKSEFRFYKKDVYLFAEVLQVPDQIRCYNCVVVDGIEALCIFLKGFTYPCWYLDMLSRFARPVLQLCMKSYQVMYFIYQTHHHRLKNFNQPCLSQASLQNYAEVIHVTGAPLQICRGFIDCTVKPVSVGNIIIINWFFHYCCCCCSSPCCWSCLWMDCCIVLTASIMWACCCLILLCSISWSSCNFLFICNPSFFTSISFSDLSSRYISVPVPNHQLFLPLGVSVSSLPFKSFLFVWAKVLRDSWCISLPVFWFFSVFPFLFESSLPYCFSNSFSFLMIYSKVASTGVNSGGAIPEPCSCSCIYYRTWDLM